jgi:hypothetical protein
MATYNSAVYTSQVGSAGKSLNAGTLLERDVQGKQRQAIVSYTALGTEATGDKVNLLKLPAGAKVIAVDCSIAATSSVGTGVTVRVGDQTTANRWAGTIDISAGGVFAFTATLGTEVVTPVAIVGPTAAGAAGTDDVVTLTFVAITSITAAKVITCLISYVLP